MRCTSFDVGSSYIIFAIFDNDYVIIHDRNNNFDNLFRQIKPQVRRKYLGKPPGTVKKAIRKFWHEFLWYQEHSNDDDNKEQDNNNNDNNNDNNNNITNIIN